MQGYLLKVKLDNPLFCFVKYFVITRGYYNQINHTVYSRSLNFLKIFYLFKSNVLRRLTPISFG